MKKKINDLTLKQFERTFCKRNLCICCPLWQYDYPCHIAIKRLAESEEKIEVADESSK